MKALQLSQYKTQAVWKECDKPQARSHEVLVQVHAAGLNPLDNMIMAGQFKQLFQYQLPQTMGNEFAGVVVAVGEDVVEFKPGDEVFARPDILRLGAFAEFVCVDAADVALKPQNLSMVEAAALPLVTLTALQAFTEKAHVKPGSRVFIQGGAGGLGSIAIQVAKYLGATVATTVSTRDIDFAKKLGADIVVDYTTQAYEDYIKDVDVVLDTLGGQETFRAMKLIKPGGSLVSVISHPDAEFANQLGKPYLKPLMWWMSRKERAAAQKHGITYRFLFMHASGEQLATITPALESGTIRPIVAHSFPATNLVDELQNLGKIKHGPGKTVAVFE
ncbi:NADP-dependent oxidoreductase [Collinsella sp. zg1085]|uniref:NADP-dependent oxidoreductase n=1 Tax=Collinsella sp. zg1085 TaxID=2844380 RepID=UPI001C0BB9F3|nr:NADP-dependent oxidoreductase [Collinsella sp. zg1085]QWT18197.1 NADP-dependent oxidoreductase [Collinsella sp. zg1085]